MKAAQSLDSVYTPALQPAEVNKGRCVAKDELLTGLGRNPSEHTIVQDTQSPYSGHLAGLTRDKASGGLHRRTLLGFLNRKEKYWSERQHETQEGIPG